MGGFKKKNTIFNLDLLLFRNIRDIIAKHGDSIHYIIYNIHDS